MEDALQLGFRLGRITTRMVEVRLLERGAADGIALPRRMSRIGKARWNEQRGEWLRWRAEDLRVVVEAKRRGQPVPSLRARALEVRKRLDLSQSVETIRKRLSVSPG